MRGGASSVAAESDDELGERKNGERANDRDFSKGEDEAPLISQQDQKKMVKLPTETEQELREIEHLFKASGAPRFSMKKGEFRRSRTTLEFINPVFEEDFQRKQQKFAQPRVREDKTH